MVKNILLATDGSKASRKAADYAVELAKKTGATLTLLTVVDTSPFVSRSIPALATPTHLAEPVEDYLRQIADAVLEQLEKICAREKVFSKRVVRTGHPVKEILKEARKSKANLIVMGHNGKGAASSLIGSVTFGVLHGDSKVPVLVIKNG
jgi:nucleotide-binding universal stress UspA family protein